MNTQDFTIDTATTNFIKNIDLDNINNTDVWLYKLDEFGQIIEQWSQVPSLEGNNAIYNSLSKNIRNIFL